MYSTQYAGKCVPYKVLLGRRRPCRVEVPCEHRGTRSQLRVDSFLSSPSRPTLPAHIERIPSTSDHVALGINQTNDVATTGRLKPIPKDVEGPADDPGLHNPLERMNRLSTGWMGVIFELEGVCVEYDNGEMTEKAWKKVAEEEAKPMPLKWQFQKAIGMKNEQVIQEVFCWSREPSAVSKIVQRKEELLSELLADRVPVVSAPAQRLLAGLKTHDTPRALVSSAPEKRVLQMIRHSAIEGAFDVVISGDDVCRGKPDPEAYLYAAQQLNRPPLRCVVIGNTNTSIEAAHEVGMRCVAVAGRTPLYELSAADLTIKSLEELTFLNLKRLFGEEETVSFEKEEEYSDV
eukprot:jgi/Picsp_1/5789/NSC_03148-R1_haloacid dehalogenase-like hydrolase domain-containing protein